MVRPKKLKHIPIDDWHAMAEADQRQLCEEAGIQTDDEIRELSRTAPPRPVHTYTPQPSKITTGTATIASPAPAQVQAEAKPKLTDIRLWDEAVDGVSGERLRNCILFQLDVRKKDFWVRNMSIAHVRRHALALDEETPPGWAPPESNPLIAEKTLPDGQTKITLITRELATDGERQTVRKRFGITSYTIPKLAKKDCPKCKGTGYYNLSTYPDHPVFKKFDDTVTCECVKE